MGMDIILTISRCSAIEALEVPTSLSNKSLNNKAILPTPISPATGTTSELSFTHNLLFEVENKIPAAVNPITGSLKFAVLVVCTLNGRLNSVYEFSGIAYQQDHLHSLKSCLKVRGKLQHLCQHMY